MEANHDTLPFPCRLPNTTSRWTVQDIPFSQGSPLSRPSGDSSVGESMLSSLWTDRCGVSCGCSLDFFYFELFECEIHLPSSWSLARLPWKLEGRSRRVVVCVLASTNACHIYAGAEAEHTSCLRASNTGLQKRKGADVSVGPLEPQRSHPFPNEECSADHVCWRYPTGAKLRPGPCTGSTHACHQISSIGEKNNQSAAGGRRYCFFPTPVPQVISYFLFSSSRGCDKAKLDLSKKII